MRLLSAGDVRGLLESGHLGISPFEEGNLSESFYYFRLGSGYQKWVSGEEGMAAREVDGEAQSFTLPANGYAIVTSLERFHLNGSFIALLGQTSALVDKGLQLNHGPTIDPTFNGRLRLGLRNLLPIAVQVHAGQIIGKVHFFAVPLEARRPGHPDTLARWKDREGSTVKP